MEDQNGSYLTNFTLNLTNKAKQRKLDPVIGRDSEIRRLMQVLSRRTKNNPVLIGDPGVGKTALVEGLANRIIAGDVPDSIKNKEILVLDIATILSGASFRGEFEKRVKNIIEEVRAKEGQYILFIDELHTLVGAGNAEGAVDAANILKPALARGELHLIGATTIDEYRKYIEKDAALERRFQPVLVEEPSQDDAIAILRGLKEKYEVHHKLKISDDALVSAVNLSVRFIPDRFLPDKAIDLIDEASSSLKIEIESMPMELDNLKRKIIQIDIELSALKKEKTETAEKRRQALEGERKEKEKQLSKFEENWKYQKEVIQKINQLQAKLDELRVNLDKAEKDIKLEEAASLKFGQIPETQKQLSDLSAQWENISPEDRLLKLEVDSEDIAKVISRWTGIPVGRISGSEIDKLLHLEDSLQKSVIGQKKAIEAVSNAIRRSRAGLSDENRPLASFLFLGPTGVGKTETAKTLARELFADEKSLIRIDMTEYTEGHSISRLIGAPPGYVGFEEGGQLTEKVRRQPYSVLLFDEVEKAHPLIFNAFLQILDDGRLTDGKGRTVNFKNTVVIMTSNLGSQFHLDDRLTGVDLDSKIFEELRKFFKPEFLNRIDQVVSFNKLSKEDIQKIITIQLNSLEQKLLSKGYQVKFDKSVHDHVLLFGYDKIFGARPIRRVIQNSIEDELALLILRDEIQTGQDHIVAMVNGKITIKNLE